MTAPRSNTRCIPFDRAARLVGLLLTACLMGSVHAQEAPIRGYADIHNHQFANLSFGGRIIVGEAYGPIESALGSHIDVDHHGANHSNDIVGAFLAARGPAVRLYGNQGYPSFSDWPDVQEVTHQKVYEDWLLRAVQGGLRLMVMLAQDSPILCPRVANDGRDCNDEDTTLLKQINAAYAMQDYVDAKWGGPGQGWYRIVTDPVQARKVMRAGKLAVVLGVETAHLFGCRTTGSCRWQEKLDYFWSRGVRHFFPIHQDDNAFGGASYFNPILQRQRGYISSIPLALITSYELATYDCPEYQVGRCNSRGLTDEGGRFIDALMDRGAIIDIDHMSLMTKRDTLNRASLRRYAGIVASHAGFNRLNNGGQDHEGQLTDADLRRIHDLGGMIGLITGQGGLTDIRTWSRPGREAVQHACGQSTETFLQAYLRAVDVVPGMPIALGTDFGGPLAQPGPRYGARACLGGRLPGAVPGTRALTYPFSAVVSGMAMDKMQSGTRVFDYNLDGLSNVGLLPDFIADLQSLGVTSRELDPLAQSAEGYVRMWEKAVGRSSPSGSLIVEIFSLFEADE